jgi:4,5-DOPA dioxygenase extradiol
LWPDAADSGQWVAEAVQGALAAAGLHVAAEDSRPLDHGVWSPLQRAWAEAPVPVLQLSLCPAAGADWHWRLGQALAPLRQQGVLIIGSGGVVHNLARLNWDDVQAEPPAWALAFMAALEPAILGREREVLTRPRSLPGGTEAVPTVEHYLPLLVSLGAGGEQIERLHDSWTHGSLGCHAYLAR